MAFDFTRTKAALKLALEPYRPAFSRYWSEREEWDYAVRKAYHLDTGYPLNTCLSMTVEQVADAVKRAEGEQQEQRRTSNF